MAASLVVIATKPTRLGLDLKGGVQLIYQGRPTAAGEGRHRIAEPRDRHHAQARRSARRRSAGNPAHRAQTKSTSRCRTSATPPRAQQQVGKTAQLFFYDWEPNVIGPDGKPSPTEAEGDGGPQPAQPETGLPEYEAVQRAVKRPAIIRKNDTTYEQGCTPKQVNGCIYGQWYLLDTTHKKVLKGPEDTEQDLYADGYKAPKGVKIKAVRVNPGTVLAQAQPITGKEGKVTQPSPESWYVLNDNPVLNGQEIKNPRQSFDNGGSGAPNVTFEFDKKGIATFKRVTREIAERGQREQLPGISKEEAQQHFAVVLDNQIITAPFINYTENPEGIDPTTGLADIGRLHAHLCAEPRRRAPVRRAADQARTDLPVAGVRDARQDRAQTGSRRGARRLLDRVPVPAHLLPRARRDRGRRPGDLRHLLLCADQADPDHADACRASPA